MFYLSDVLITITLIHTTVGWVPNVPAEMGRAKHNLITFENPLNRCVFPFVYNGKRYEECTTEGGRAPWCSLDRVFKGKWSYCRSYGNCVFPFTLMHGTFKIRGCTDLFGRAPWCSLDQEYRGLWRYCGGGSGPCKIPFKYGGMRKTGCISTFPGESPWCSMDYEYVGNWRYCTENEVQGKFGGSGSKNSAPSNITEIEEEGEGIAATPIIIIVVSVLAVIVIIIVVVIILVSRDTDKALDSSISGGNSRSKSARSATITEGSTMDTGKKTLSKSLRSESHGKTSGGLSRKMIMN